MYKHGCRKIFLFMSLLGFLALSACAWSPVRTPYAYKADQAEPVERRATIWGRYGRQKIFFTRVNDDSLPSRRGGGVPLSLSLSPGRYTLEAIVSEYTIDRVYRHATVSLSVSVDAGHSYLVDPVVSDDNSRVRLALKDLGLGFTCAYDDYEGYGAFTAAKLQCRKSAE